VVEVMVAAFEFLTVVMASMTVSPVWYVDGDRYAPAALEDFQRTLTELVERLVLGDLLNHVSDKGVMISGAVTISAADIDLIELDLRLLLTAIETSIQSGIDRSMQGLVAGVDLERRGGVSPP